jgi:putative DNA primase/helicase
MLMLRDEALEEAKTPENFKSALAKAQWATNSLNLGRIRAAVSLSSTREKVRITMNDLDARDTRFLLNVKNGVIDLKTGELSPHNPELMITKLVDYNYKPSAKCPFWEHTFELAFGGNKDLINYMRRAIGYSITGSAAEQCLFICWGEQGNNGKSTILETLQWLCGPYSQMSDMKVITSPDMDNRVASSLAKLPGVRLVSMNEADENQKLSEALVKQLTGGDTIQACKKFQAPFEFIPVFKLWIRTNEKPAIRGMSDAIWRRIKLIPFANSIPAEFRKSRDEVDDALHSEAEGILAWCVRGAMEWIEGGLKDPDEVSAATAGYRSEQDVITTFFDECIVEKSEAHVARNELYQVFSRWAHDNGLRFVMSSDAFGKRVGLKLQQRERVKVRGQYVWKGIALSEFAQNQLIS